MVSIFDLRCQSGHKTAEEALATAERLDKVAYETLDGRFLCVPRSLFISRDGERVPMALLYRDSQGWIFRDYYNWPVA